DGTSEVELDSIERQRGRKIFPGDEFGENGSPGRCFDGVSKGQCEGQEEKEPRRYQVRERGSSKKDGDSEHPQLGPQNELAPVDDVSDGAGGKREEEERQGRSGLDQGNVDRVAAERSHQPR